MNSIIAGAKTSLFSFSIITLVLVFVINNDSLWLPLHDYFDFSFQVISVIVILFAAQFNQSRFSLISFFLILLFYSQQASSPILTSWQGNGEWQILSSCFVFAYLSWIKDRGILSIHLLSRLLSLSLLIALAYGYLLGINIAIEAYPELIWLSEYRTYWLIYLPLTLSIVTTIIPAILYKHLFQPAVLFTSVLLMLFYFEWVTIDLSFSFVILSLYFLLSVITSSYLLAYRDELTALPSRRALYQTALSLGRKYSVAMMDIDHFKKFNDTYGHDVGDQVLKLVAMQLSKVKSGGRVFRYGGEEFTVIFPRKNAEQTVDELQKLRQAIAEYKMVIRQPNRKGKDGRKGNSSSNTKSVSVTISIGVSSREKKQSFDQVMKAADEKLYKAKKSGRNNVTH